MKKQDQNKMDDDLLIRYLAAEVTDAERAQVEKWLAEGDENKKGLAHLRIIMDESKDLKPMQTADANAAWKRFEQKIDLAPDPIERGSRLKVWLSIAATVLILFSVSTWFYLRGPGQHELSSDIQSAGNTYTTFAATDTSRIDTLSDGSIIALNKNSSLTYPSHQNNGQRNVILKGDAFFSVVHDVEHPFRVRVNNVLINVLGTSFNVKSIGDQTEIIVKTGIVGVTSGNKSAKIYSGEKLLVTPGNTNWKKEADTGFDLNKYPGLVKLILRNPKKWSQLLKNYVPQNDTSSARGKNRAVIRSVIHDLVQDKIVPDGGVRSFRLNWGELLVNDKQQPEPIHQKFKAKYLKGPGFTIYYGNAPAQGKGIFVSPDSL